TTVLYTLSLHDALPIYGAAHHGARGDRLPRLGRDRGPACGTRPLRVGGRARNGAPRAPGHHGGALPVVQPEARERRGEGAGAPEIGSTRLNSSHLVISY